MWVEFNQYKGLALPSIPDRTPVWTDTHTHTVRLEPQLCVCTESVSYSSYSREAMQAAAQEAAQTQTRFIKVVCQTARVSKWITLSTFRFLHLQAFTFDKTRTSNTSYELFPAAGNNYTPQYSCGRKQTSVSISTGSVLFWNSGHIYTSFG